MTDETPQPGSSAKPWEAYGYGKHDYRHVDPNTINPNEYARNLRGDEAHFGDVREYNSAFNTKHPENDVTLDWLGRIGTTFETEAEGYEGEWMVVRMPAVKAPVTYARVCRMDADRSPLEDTLVLLSCVDLGCAVDEKNFFRQVKTKLTSKGKVDRTQRERLTKKK